MGTWPVRWVVVIERALSVIAFGNGGNAGLCQKAVTITVWSILVACVRLPFARPAYTQQGTQMLILN